eukprot:762638-Hanusia_phi.AAC.8
MISTAARCSAVYKREVRRTKSQGTRGSVEGDRWQQAAAAAAASGPAARGGGKIESQPAAGDKIHSRR